MAQYEVNNVSINSILSWIESEEVSIPEIQRPFVWNATKVRDLIDSLYHGYPVGYIIIWKNPDVRLKDGSVSIGKKILIDGQQRITALNAAILGNKVISKDYRKRNIDIAFNPIEEKFEVRNPAINKDIKWIPTISEIFNSNFNSYEFIENYSEKNFIKDKNSINKIIMKLMDIKNHNIGVIELSHTLDIEEVTNIFIRINSKGVVLSQADFVMSKIASSNLNERNYIRKTIDYFSNLMKRPGDLEHIEKNDLDFSNSEYFNQIKWVAEENNKIYVPDYKDILRVSFTFKFRRGKLSDLVSLLSGRDFEKREYSEEIEEESYDKLKDGVSSFINKINFNRFIMIIKSIGIVDKSLIRSQNALNFAYALFLALREENINGATIEKVVRKWLVLSILTSRYSSSAESTFDFDIKKFTEKDPLSYLEEVEEGELSAAFWNNVLANNLKTSVSSSPYFKLFLISQIYYKDKGFLSSHIDIKSLVEQRGDRHHLFPKKYLIKNGITDKTQYNQIANYAYTQQEINILIKDKSPKEYMSQIYKQISNGEEKLGGIINKEELKRNLKENCLPEGFENMEYDKYEDFLEKRQKLMVEKIKSYYYSLN